ncbi:MAG: hypothetical protein KGY41_03620 [Desulfovermiculus sp.]|nr:hypothetical protein [Desulfovermiculus sp.]
MNLEHLTQAIGRIHATAQMQAGQAINRVLNCRNWLIGAYIVEFEQGGEDRAEYGEKVLEALADRLKDSGHRGLSLRNLKNFRQVALSYPRPEIRQTLSAVLTAQENHASTDLQGSRIRQTVSAELPELVHFPRLQGKTPDLPWRDGSWTERLFASLSFSHLLELARVKDPLQRAFYELECIKSGWSVRELKRQRESMLYERVGLSKDPEAVMSLAQDGRLVDSPETILRDPYVLEFTGWRNGRSTASRIWKKRCWTIWRPFCWSWAGTSVLWSARCASPLLAAIIFWICYFFIVDCGAWWRLI